MPGIINPVCTRSIKIKKSDQCSTAVKTQWKETWCSVEREPRLDCGITIVREPEGDAKH